MRCIARPVWHGAKQRRAVERGRYTIEMAVNKAQLMEALQPPLAAGESVADRFHTIFMPLRRVPGRKQNPQPF